MRVAMLRTKAQRLPLVFGGEALDSGRFDAPLSELRAAGVRADARERRAEPQHREGGLMRPPDRVTAP